MTSLIENWKARSLYSDNPLKMRFKWQITEKVPSFKLWDWALKTGSPAITQVCEVWLSHMHNFSTPRCLLLKMQYKCEPHWCSLCCNKLSIWNELVVEVIYLFAFNNLEKHYAMHLWKLQAESINKSQLGQL